MTTSTPPPVSPAPTPKKGLSALQWVLIILGGLFVLMAGSCVACGLVVTNAARNLAADFEANPAKAAAEMAVRLNPDLELVSSDDDAGTMTIRNTETGEELTVDFSDVADGNFTFRTDEGEVRMSAEEGGITTTGPGGETSRFGTISDSDIPAWVIRYSGAELAEGGFFQHSAESAGGSFAVTTDDSIDDVAARLQQDLEAAGYQVQVTTSTGPDGRSSMLIAQLADPERTQNFFITTEEGRTHVTVQYNGKP